MIVIARASGGEPLKRMVIKVLNKRAYLANPERIAAVQAGESDPVGFPLDDIFSFDDNIFARLRREWELTGTAAEWGNHPARLSTIRNVDT